MPRRWSRWPARTATRRCWQACCPGRRSDWTRRGPAAGRSRPSPRRWNWPAASSRTWRCSRSTRRSPRRRWRAPANSGSTRTSSTSTGRASAWATRSPRPVPGWSPRRSTNCAGAVAESACCPCAPAAAWVPRWSSRWPEMTALITEGLFRVDGARAVLFASRRRSSGAVKFPAERPELFDGDPEIQEDIEPIELSTEGTLYTYTTQEFPPPLPYKGNRSPDLFRPYVVGFVELAEGVLVETLIVDATAAELRIGQPLVSTTTTLETDGGQSLLTFAFRPASES